MVKYEGGTIMYIDKYNIKIIGQEYNHKKEKYINEKIAVSTKFIVSVLLETFTIHKVNT